MSELLEFSTVHGALHARCLYSEVTALQKIQGEQEVRQEYMDKGQLTWPSREAFMAIYTTDQIKQLQIDTQWPGTVDLYEHIKNYVRDRYKCKD